MYSDTQTARGTSALEVSKGLVRELGQGYRILDLLSCRELDCLKLSIQIASVSTVRPMLTVLIPHP